jgi:hypothetical protein
MDRASLPRQHGQILPRRAVPGPWQVLWRYTEVSRVTYVVVAAATSLALSALTVGLYWVVTVPGLGLTPPATSEPLPHVAEMLLGWVVLAPLAETLVLATVLALFGRFIARPGLLVLAGALPIGVAHGLLGTNAFDVGGHAVVSTTGFLVFAVVYVAWRRSTFKDAFWMCALVHMVHNLCVVAFAYVDQSIWARIGGS